MLSGQTAIVTGAGRNVGRGIADRLADNGANVVVFEIDEERANDVVDALPTDDGQDHYAAVADATDEDDVARVADEAEERYGDVDILVNNLGYAANKHLFDLEFEDWDRVYRLTLWSTFLCSKVIGERIAHGDGDGAIVNIATGLADHAIPNKIPYCAAKAGVLNMTRALALDLADYDVRVNSVSPGTVGNPVGRTEGKEDRDTSRIPLGRLGRPDDIGNAVVFLASDMAEYITGEDLSVNGGMS